MEDPGVGFKRFNSVSAGSNKKYNLEHELNCS